MLSFSSDVYAFLEGFVLLDSIVTIGVRMFFPIDISRLGHKGVVRWEYETVT